MTLLHGTGRAYLVGARRWYEWTQTGNKVPYYTKHKDNNFVISKLAEPLYCDFLC